MSEFSIYKISHQHGKKDVHLPFLSPCLRVSALLIPSCSLGIAIIFIIYTNFTLIQQYQRHDDESTSRRAVERRPGAASYGCNGDVQVTACTRFVHGGGLAHARL
ncbi:hypothetical protein PUN28_012819 [Cardiocondyla obscurior]|uniref:Uncharacterized protein n=1 Tax=Cardiocondyla obscurior TaxID=286306 RepID=A0AAW2FB15_9HYME